MGLITIGVTGRGETSQANAISNIADFIERDEDSAYEFVLDLTYLGSEGVSGAVKAAYGIAKSNDISYDVVTPASQDSLRDALYEEIVANARKQTKANSAAVVVARESSVLLMAWDDTDAECQKALLAAERKGILAYDVCQGLVPLAFEDESEETDTTPEQFDKQWAQGEPVEVVVSPDLVITRDDDKEEYLTDEPVETEYERGKRLAEKYISDRPLNDDDIAAGKAVAEHLGLLRETATVPVEDATAKGGMIGGKPVLGPILETADVEPKRFTTPAYRTGMSALPADDEVDRIREAIRAEVDFIADAVVEAVIERVVPLLKRPVGRPRKTPVE